MKESRVVWTVLPNFGDESAIRLTLYASLIIQPLTGQDESPLASLHPFDDWPTAIESITKRHLLFTGDNGSRHVLSIADAETSFSAVEASRIWRTLLPRDTPVQPYSSNIKGYGVRSYGAHLLENALRELYVRAARLAPQDYPDRRTWKQILLALTPDDIREIDRMRAYFAGLNEPRADNIPDRTGLPDFNAIVTALNAYPVLQRLVGLAIDVRITAYHGLPERGAVRLLGAPPRSVPFRVLAPSTEYIMKGRQPWRFQAYDARGERTLNGLLPIGDSRYALSFVNVESNATFFHDPQIQDEDDGDGDTNQYQMPSFTSAGISLLDTQAEDHLKQRLSRTLKLEQAAATAPGDGDDGPAPFGLDSNDVSQGLRVDVFDTKSARWMSLCRRAGEYRLGHGSSPILVGPVEDEGMATRVAAAPVDYERPEQEFFVSPSLFEWEGWSLCVDMPETPADSNSGTCKVDVSFTVPPGTLPRLRFGDSYRMRVRTVDLGGNSIPPELADDFSDVSNTIETTYRRIDPISSPQLIPAKPLQSDRGDSEDVFVLRSNYDVSADEYLSVHKYPAPLRHIAPPEVEQKFAEKHGVFDRESGMDPEAYTTIKTRESEFADSIGTAPAQVPYLSDPLATRFQLRLLGNRLVSSYPQDTGWPNVKTSLLRLQEGSLGFHSSDDGHVVTLDKANSISLRISSALSTDLNPRIWLQHAEWAGSYMTDRGILEGDHWLITPYRNIRLIHAVQQPLLEPTLSLAEARDGLGMRLSQAGDTSLQLEGLLGYDGRSTGSADVLGSRREWRDDPTVGPPSVVTTNDHLFSGPVPDDGQQIVFGGRARELRHNFDDTKTHLIRYSAIATTRFLEFFPRNEQLDFTRTSSESDINANSTVRRLSTVRPPKPDIAYVVPILQQFVEGTPQHFESQRRALSLRIYLRRPWFVSGDDERVGLVVHGDDDMADRYCAWGADPVRQTDGTLRPLRRSNFAEPVEISHDRFPGSDRSVDMLLYKVQYDAARELWYADIRFTDVPTYMPFVRLAVLRYQPWSLGQPSTLDSLRCSELAPIEYMQLLNDRSSVIRAIGNDGQTATYSVAVQGVELHRCAAYYQSRPSGSGEFAWEDASVAVELATLGSDNKTGTIVLHLQSQTEYRVVLFETESRIADLKSLNSRQTYIECFELGELTRPI